MAFSRSRLLQLTFIIEGLVLLAALVSSEFLGIRLFPLTDDLIQDILIGTIGAFLPFACLLFLLSKSAEKISLTASLKKTIISDVKVIFSKLKFLDIVFISLLAGFAEEILFRGVIQAKSGIVLASILFGVLHPVSALYVLAAIIMGFYIGLFFLIYESLLVPIQLHFTYDLGALIYIRYFVKSDLK